MENASPFADLNDDLSDLIGSPLRSKPVAPPEHYRPVDFTEPCPKCRGTGRFVSYTGRILGPCFTCKGEGKRTFKTAPAQRAKNRATASARKERVEAEKRAALQAEAEAFTAANPDVVKWLIAAAPAATSRGWAFPQSMLDAIFRWGRLTDGQLAAVRKCMDRDAQRATERAAREATAVAVDVSKIEAAFKHAREAADQDGEGVKWLKLHLDTFKFSDAPARGQWPAAIFVKEGDRKLGRIVGGKFIRSFACDDATEARVVAAAADPFTAAKAYGLRTSSCSCCGRELTNAESRRLGIGPICRAKYGWGE